MTKRTIKSLQIQFYCKRECEEGDEKVKEHDLITEKYRASAQQDCNLNLSLSKKIPVVFQNFENYDSHLILQEIEEYDLKINVIKEINEFTIQQPKKKNI